MSILTPDSIPSSASSSVTPDGYVVFTVTSPHSPPGVRPSLLSPKPDELSAPLRTSPLLSAPLRTSPREAAVLADRAEKSPERRTAVLQGTGALQAKKNKDDCTCVVSLWQELYTAYAHLCFRPCSYSAFHRIILYFRSVPLNHWACSGL